MAQPRLLSCILAAAVLQKLSVMLAGGAACLRDFGVLPW
jgi:hypothetical protein